MKKKNPDNQIQKRKDDLQEYMHVTLSVLSQENVESDDCPDPEDLAAFTEGRLAGVERKAVMAHINNCTSCRRHWLMIQSALEEMSLGDATWKEKIIHKLKELMPHRLLAGAGIGIVVATCLLLVVIIPQKDELSKMISESYMSLSPNDIANYNSFANRGEAEDLGQFQSEMLSEFYMNSSPNETARYNSFVNDGEDKELDPLQSQPQPQPQSQSQSDALLAFKAGIAAGRARLLSQTETTNKAVDQEALSPLLYSLGRWMVVLQCACISEEPASDKFWSDHEEIALKLQDEIKHSTSDEIEEHPLLVQTVLTIKNDIKSIRETGEQGNGCEDIKKAIDSLENHLYSTPNLTN